MDEVVEKQLKIIEAQWKLIDSYKNMLKEIESQLDDRGGFDILRASINEVLK